MSVSDWSDSLHRPDRGLLCAALTLLLTLGGMGLLHAQKIPKRPKLAADKDSNSAVAYYELGFSSLKEMNTARAADAFYWAARLEPSWGEPIYGRFVALLMQRPLNQIRIFWSEPQNRLDIPDLKALHSLAISALYRNPYVDRRLSGIALAEYISQETGGTYRLQDLTTYNKRFNAWAAYANGEYAKATKLFREEIARDSTNYDLLIDQSQNFLAQGRPDSARVLVQQALRIQRRMDDDMLQLGWMPNAFLEYSVGFLFSLEEQWDSARAAYERALLDDLTFHPAHRELGRMRLIGRDTSKAIDEYAAAVTLAPKDPAYLYQLGLLLLSTRKVDSATKVLKRAVEAESYFAPPYYLLGRIYDQSGYPEEAVEYYRGFVLRAPRTLSSTITTVQKRLDVLAPR